MLMHVPPLVRLLASRPSTDSIVTPSGPQPDRGHCATVTWSGTSMVVPVLSLLTTMGPWGVG